MKRKKRIFTVILLTAVICLCGYELWKMSERYVQEEQLKKKLIAYRPPDILNITETVKDSTHDYGDFSGEELQKSQNNQFIADLQNEISEDIAGWIFVPGTKIDYPFVKAKDNYYYLRRDIFGNYAAAGTIFMDYRCPEDFTGFNTIIYGHNMKNGSMFGDLLLFEDESFFESNRFGTIFLKDKTYNLEFFACMVVGGNDYIIYNPYATPEDSDEFFEYVKEFARIYRTPETDNNIVVLSTCSSDGSVRIVLLANITEYKSQTGGKEKR